MNFFDFAFASKRQQIRRGRFLTNRWYRAGKDALAALQRRADAGDEVAVKKVQNRTQALEKGRAVADITAANNVRMEKVTAFQNIVKPHVEACLYNKLSTLQAVADCLNTKGIRTKRGSIWNPTAVRRLILALGLPLPKAA